MQQKEMRSLIDADTNGTHRDARWVIVMKGTFQTQLITLYGRLTQNHQSSHACWMCFDMTWQPTWQLGI